ncbi:Biopolymer transport protein ExbD/TolR, partial [sediment metagenome]
MARKANLETTMDMTPMIDCVFQLMIFFIVTFKLDADMINEKIELAQSPHGPAIE